MTSICKILSVVIKFVFIYSVALDINAGSPSGAEPLKDPGEGRQLLKGSSCGGIIGILSHEAKRGKREQ